MSSRPCLPTIVFVVLAFCPQVLWGAEPLQAEADLCPETADFQETGREFVIDDVWFQGCFHNAFEGLPVKEEDGSFKAGKQGIQKTKGILTGAGSSTSAMHVEFELKEAPGGPVQLAITGLDDSADTENEVVVEINGATIGKALRVPKNRTFESGIKNDRYLIGWGEERITVPEGILRKGKNTLSIANTTSCFDVPTWNYVAIDQIGLMFPKEAVLRIPKLSRMPVLYYGLSYGPEVNAWPAVNLGNRITLVESTPLQTNFFVTLPADKPLGKEGPLTDQAKKLTRNVVLHLETDADLQVLNAEGSVVAAKSVSGKAQYALPLTRLGSFETPHPSQGATVFIRGGKPFEGKSMKAWVSIDDVPYRETVYELRNIALKPLKDRDALDFDLGIWGGQIPEEGKSMQEYIAAARAAGFNELFTGDKQELNTSLKKAGFKVFPRYGWFGHQFKVSEDLAKYAAIDAAGKPMPKDFCPLAILENPEHPELGKFFQRARDNARQSDIDGICVDYETAPVWCYCDKCLAKFEEETGRSKVDRKDIVLGGALEEEFMDSGRRRNRDLLAKVKEVIQKENPKLKYHSLASASDIPSYWFDGRTGGRHSVRELAKFADAIYASAYFYEVPGGIKSVLPIIRTVKGYAHESGREVGTYLISPVATTISEFPRYRGTWMKPDFTKMLIQVAGLGGARGVLLFRGDCLDGEYFQACQEAIRSLLAVHPYIEKGIDRSDELTVTPVAGEARVFDTEIAQHLLSRMVWHPSEDYEFDAIQLLENTAGKKRLMAFFNYSSRPRDYQVAVRGLFDPEYQLTDFTTKESLGTLGRIPLEAGKWKVSVPARSCRFVELTASDLPKNSHPSP